MNVAEFVGRTLGKLGVARAFGVVGSGNFEMTNALRAEGVEFVAARHECGAATMADAYSRMSGRLGVVSTHQGPGLTNALTGIAEAAKSRTPLLVLTGDTAAAAIRSNFRIAQDAAVSAVGAVAERVYSAETAEADTMRAVRTVMFERRTVVLNLPLDVQRQPAPTVSHGIVPKPYASQAIRPGPSDVKGLAEFIATAERPVFLAGRGARNAGPELRELAAAAGALLATSAVANGLFSGDPWSLGISGGFASPLAAELISNADMLVAWGCSLNMWTTRHGKLINPRTLVAQVDLDASALGAHRVVPIGVVGDVAQTARDVLAELEPRTGYRTEAVRARIAESVRWRDVPFEEASTAERIDPRRLSILLDDLLPTQRIVAVDSGNFMGYPSAYLSVPDERGFCFTQAFQSIGLGLATAIGAALAQPDRLPVAALGDGGCLMSIAELDTAVRLGLPLVIVVYNDEAYGAEVHHFGPDGADLTTVQFPETDIAAIARGFGCNAATIRAPSDLAHLTDWLAGPRDRPLLLDAKITSDGGSWWLAEAFRGH
ncbi:MAG TPA: thiamine pyrophosphate-binding protein [Actinophytocola sp.]|uniref:thiamine pyrophosphate-binding protein n=1 Tax=Actinophytocola sp. TaxID=1872138 RepID=UPI002DDCEBFA|nr:thiamine pyrophosphate-binding protein [Actinophytocola sp.]HEV2779300.1 thiamine pyrophosphate-binding protein [Actinophytocola sp.]